MRQSLRILQMPFGELKDHVAEELAGNPFLEEIERGRVSAAQKQRQGEEGPEKVMEARDESSLFDHLSLQWERLRLPENEYRIGKAILEDLDENGYLVSPLLAIAQDCAVEMAEAERALTHVQRLDPPGIACRDLGECLRIQIGRLGSEDEARKALMRRIVTEHLEDLMRMAWRCIAQVLKVPTEDVMAAVAVIRKLNPKPGRAFGTFVPDYIVPDVIFSARRGGYEALCNKRELPDLKIRSSYRKLLMDPRTPLDVRQYLREKLNNAITFMRALEKRASTLERIAACLAQEQAGFLRKGRSELKPLRMNGLARRLGLHKSTLSRAVSGKYAQTQQGIVPLRVFFDNAVGEEGKEHSSSAVKNRIQLLIKKESSQRPVSDGRIAELLKSQGICVARRTVAKYRQSLRLRSSYIRKHNFTLSSLTKN